jgi:NADPH:quinone reductase-like Zn-dependent oxidoreductase
MRAASLNYRDLLMVRGEYNPRQKLPLIPLSDGVGEVIGLGEGAGRVQVGQRVCPIFAPRWIAGELTRERQRHTLGGPLDGTLAEYIVADAESVVPVPDGLSDEEAACLPCAAVTAWNALFVHGRIGPGQTVLTQGTGGVALFALQFAKMAGAHVIATSSSSEKLARLREMGASHTIDYVKDSDWANTARNLTGGFGVDHVIDVGGRATLPNSLRAVRPAGTISIIGNLSGSKLEVDLLPILMQNVRVQGVFVGHRESFEHMLRGMSGTLRPIIDHTFSWTEARLAFERLSRREHLGKICLRLD